VLIWQCDELTPGNDLSS